MAEVFRAREAFAYTDKQGVPRVVAPGHLMSSNDPNFKGKEHLFEPVEVAAAREAHTTDSNVETATAEPGARRSVSTPKRRGRGGKDDDTEVGDQAEKMEPESSAGSTEA